MASLPVWYRASPWLGIIGGLLLGVVVQLGLDTRSTWWLDAVGITALFDIFAPLGYLALALVGFVVGWASRAVQRRAGLVE